ncbi:MAG: SPASM domain-containing protein, partial [Deltaproteobacteria bacterium]|nr:SPASM domain-containing protein [Deltaproteobacteria bacterium]
TWKVIDILDQAQAMGFNGRAAFHHYCEPLLDQRNLLFAKEAKERGMKPYLVTNGDRLHGDERLRQEVQHLYERIVVGIYDYETNEKLEEAKQYWKRMLPSADVDFSVPDLTYTNAPCHRPLVRMIIQYDGDVCNCCDDTFGAFQLGNVYQNTLAEIWFSREHRQILDDLVSGRREKYELCRGCPQGPTGPAPEGKKIGISIRRYQGSGAPQ